MPVDSNYERRALWTPGNTLWNLHRKFPDAEFELEKPLFDIDTLEGPCLPDFLIRARRGHDEFPFVIEVMGFERPDYLQGKEDRHTRMAWLGTMCMMQGSAFDRSTDGVKNVGCRVTNRILAVLGSRWNI